jgi:hypothetical protein
MTMADKNISSRVKDWQPKVNFISDNTTKTHF